MERRKFLLGLGSLAAGSAATIGSGAFDSAEIRDRDFQATVRVDNHSNQLLRLRPGASPYATLDGDGKLLIDMDALAQDSEYSFSDLFEVQNNGRNQVQLRVQLTDNPDGAVNEVPGESPNDSHSNIRWGTGNRLRLDSGNVASLGANIEVGDGIGTFGGEFTIVAEEP